MASWYHMKVNSEIPLPPQHFMKRINNWLSPKCGPIRSTKHGTGEFAKQPILKGEAIAIFGGAVRTREERDALPEDVRYLQLGIDEDMFIGPGNAEERDDADWFNHSCDPNAGIYGQITLVAMRDIQPDEEITFDYVMCAAQQGEKRILFPCNCQSASCRKEVTSHDWKSPILQKKYRGYFSSFIQRLIEQSHKEQ